MTIRSFIEDGVESFEAQIDGSRDRGPESAVEASHKQ